MRAARSSGRARTGDKICGVVRSSLRRATGRNFIYTYSASFLLNTAFRFTSYLALTSPCLTLPYPSSPRRSPLPSPCRGSSRFAAPLPPSSSVRRPTSSTRSASSPDALDRHASELLVPTISPRCSPAPSSNLTSFRDVSPV